MPYIIEHDDGTFTETEERPTTSNGHLGGSAVQWQETDRFSDPTGTEVRNWKARRWDVVPEIAAARINREHEAAEGLLAIALARATKAIEARLMLAGVEIPGGMIELEAHATGQEPMALARIVFAKSTAAAQAEAERIMARRKLLAV